MPRSSQLVCLGLSYRTASVAVRERVRCTLQDLAQLRQDAPQQYESIHEMALISTCNRLELYAAVAVAPGQEPATPIAGDGHVDAAVTPLLALLAAANSIPIAEIEGHVYWMKDLAVHEHLAQVAAGLQSMVLGEPQILGQVTDAFVQAVEERTAGPMITALMRSAMRVGKRAHHETAISTKPASISSVAVAMADKTLGRLPAHSVMVIGAGEMGLQTLKALHARQVKQVLVVNRTEAKGAVVAKRFGYPTAPWQEMTTLLSQVDLVITATGAPAAVLNAPMVQDAMARRNGRPLHIIDIALPRDVEPDVRTVPAVHLTDIDQLNAAVDDALSARRDEVPRVEAIIAEEQARFTVSLAQLSVEPIIADLRKQAESIRAREVQRTLRFLGNDVDPETLKHIQHLSRALVNKLLHEPTVRLKQKAGNGDGAEYANTLTELFGLPQNGLQNVPSVLSASNGHRNEKSNRSS